MGRRTAVIAVFIALIVVLAAIPIGLAMTDHGNGEKEVVNGLMKMKGIEKDGTVSYKNIPYAEAPVGDLRFKPTVFKEADWTEVKDCTKFGNISIQGTSYFSDNDDPPVRKEHKDNESEDCLNLNIWAPADAKKGDNLPVYFWIHGGALISGSGQEDLYDGTAFTKQDVIVVTINYRLGTLGFLGLDAFKGDNDLGTTGNWGTLDQITALKWVNKYIENFGGDPKNITISGESAGSFSVMNLVLSPLSNGLFQKAIMESGAQMHLLDAARSYKDAVTVANNIVSDLGIDPTSSDAIKKLREMDAFKLADACYFNGYLYMDHSHSVWSVNDGVVLKNDNNHITIENGTYNNVKMIIGYNYNEGFLFVSKNVTDQQMDKFINETFEPADATKVKDYYAKQTMKTTYEKMLELVSMTMFKMGTVDSLEHFVEHGSAVYGYEFSHKTNGKIIAFHGVETAYAFGQDHLFDIEFDTNDMIIMNKMHQYWVNFIKTGDPNGYNLSTWARYDTNAEEAMNFATATCSTETWFDSTVLYKFKDPYFKWYIPPVP